MFDIKLRHGLRALRDSPGNRRPLKSRETGWARSCAAALARLGVDPDAVSAASVVFAIWGLAAFLWAGRFEGVTHSVVLFGAAAAIQLRLLCNLLDGMVAVEHGRGGPAGAVWNEFPDRISDCLFLVGAGYCATQDGVDWAAAAGWLAALLAIMTAYVRELGRALGQTADFSGPGGKPQRMAVLTVVVIVSAIAEPHWLRSGSVIATGLALIALLAAVTVIRRLLTLVARLAPPQDDPMSDFRPGPR